MRNGIDVSKWQGAIDWDKVKAAGVEYAILRIGYGKKTSQKDGQFERNYTECKRLGIPVGIYLYSYALSVEGAREEAKTCLNWLAGRKLDLPIYFDIEDATQSGFSKDILTNMCKAFCEEIEKAGYWAGVYANKYWLTEKLNGSELEKQYTIWVAQYASKCTYAGKYDIWQYSSSGAVAGIAGKVDMNYMYRDLISEIKGGPAQNEQKTEQNKQEEAKPVENVEKPVQNFTTYKIKPGDTLSGIAEKYNTTYQYLAQINNIADPNKINAGAVIKVPTTEVAAQGPGMRIGAKVEYKGYLYRDSYGNGKGRYVEGKYTVTTIIENRTFGINLNNGLGWVKGSDCKVIG